MVGLTLIETQKQTTQQQQQQQQQQQEKEQQQNRPEIGEFLHIMF